MTTAGDGSGLRVDEARALIAAAIQPIADPIADVQTVPLADALGRVLAADVISPIAVPAHDNSAMDGYAFASADLRAGQPLTLRCVGTALAGRPHAGALASGACLRIMTGAVLPAGLDTVAPHELCTVQDTSVHVPADAVRPGDNRRLRGEDLAPGQAALHAGRVLQAADLGLVASLGVRELAVRRRLRVAVFSTGDELRTAGQPLDEGCIYDSNRRSLMAAVQRLGMEVIDLGVVRDDPTALHDTLTAAIAQADAVLTSGGVSMGDADHVRPMLEQLGQVAFWKLAIRPGRPFAFGPLHRAAGNPAWLFALPGNPVAALVAFYVLAREGLLKLAGAQCPPLPMLQARCVGGIRKRPGRTEYQRGIVEPAPGGGWQVRLTGPQGSGLLHSMSQANALLVLPHDGGNVADGEPVEVWLFEGLI